MTDNVVKFPERPETGEYFGGCPHCGQTDGYVNIGREHWFVCDRHKTKWHVGSNLFSCWRHEDEETWRRNEYLLQNYMTVDPIYPTPTAEEIERRKALDRERALHDALGAVMVSPSPIDPADTWNFDDLLNDFERQPDKLFILTKDGRAYDLGREEAEAPYDAHVAGDNAAIKRLLQTTPSRTARGPQ